MPKDSEGYHETSFYLFIFFPRDHILLFILVQVDNEYRMAWDQFVLKLDVVDSDPQSGSEVLHWVTKFPVSTEKDY